MQGREGLPAPPKQKSLILSLNFPQDSEDESWKWNVDTSQFSPSWQFWLLHWVPFVVAHRKEGDLLKLNRPPLTLSSEGWTLQTKVRVTDYCREKKGTALKNVLNMSECKQQSTNRLWLCSLPPRSLPENHKHSSVWTSVASRGE